jgi:hypothetical protein
MIVKRWDGWTDKKGESQRWGGTETAVWDKINQRIYSWRNYRDIFEISEHDANRDVRVGQEELEFIESMVVKNSGIRDKNR